jgi:hypothetical protein
MDGADVQDAHYETIGGVKKQIEYKCIKCPKDGTCDGGPEVICARTHSLIYLSLPDTSEPWCEPCPTGAKCSDGTCAFGANNASSCTAEAITVFSAADPAASPPKAREMMRAFGVWQPDLDSADQLNGWNGTRASLIQDHRSSVNNKYFLPFQNSLQALSSVVASFGLARNKLVACPAGFSRKGKYARSVSLEVEFDKQECVRCLPLLEYILDPNNDVCQKCPPGLTCHGNSQVEPVVARSQWLIEGDHFRLTICPTGYEVISDNVNWHQQLCRPCSEGSECVLENCTVCTVCDTGKFKDMPGTHACQQCPSNTYNPDTNKKSPQDCRSCPEGAETNGIGKTNLSDCSCAVRFYHTPRTPIWTCSTCPQGAVCNDGSCSLRDETEPSCASGLQPIGAKFWKLGSLIGKSGDDAGKKWLIACPTGYSLQNLAHDVQKCDACDNGLECTLDNCTGCTACNFGHYKDKKSTDPCQPCPANSFRDKTGGRALTDCTSCPDNAGTLSLTGASISQKSSL